MYSSYHYVIFSPVLLKLSYKAFEIVLDLVLN